VTHVRIALQLPSGLRVHAPEGRRVASAADHKKIWQPLGLTTWAGCCPQTSRALCVSATREQKMTSCTPRALAGALKREQRQDHRETLTCYRPKVAGPPAGNIARAHGCRGCQELRSATGSTHGGLRTGQTGKKQPLTEAQLTSPGTGSTPFQSAASAAPQTQTHTRTQDAHSHTISKRRIGSATHTHAQTRTYTHTRRTQSHHFITPHRQRHRHTDTHTNTHIHTRHAQ
jgi:hypothetical protein